MFNNKIFMLVGLALTFNTYAGSGISRPSNQGTPDHIMAKKALREYKMKQSSLKEVAKAPPCQDGYTPVMAAIVWSCPALARTLVDLDADTISTNNHGDSCLSLVVRKKEAEYIALLSVLLSTKAPLNAVCLANTNALDWAILFDNNAAAQALIEEGIEIRPKTIQLALGSNKQTDIVRLLHHINPELVMQQVKNMKKIAEANKIFLVDPNISSQEKAKFNRIAFERMANIIRRNKQVRSIAKTPKFADISLITQ